MIFRFTPPKLNKGENEIAIRRAIISMALKIPENLIETRVGQKTTQAQTWELEKGLRIGAHTWHITSQPKTLQEMKDVLSVEIEKGFILDMEGEVPLQEN